MGNIEFAGVKAEITPEDYYVLMISVSERMLRCHQNMGMASSQGDFDYWRKEHDKTMAVRMKLLTHID